MTRVDTNTLLVFATLREAAPTIRKLKAVQDIPARRYLYDQGTIVISGMGAVAAASAVGQYGPGVSRIINLGIAGALNSTCTLGQHVTISTVMRNPILPDAIDDHSRHLHNSLFPTLTVSSGGLRLITSDYPVHHPSLNTTLQQYGDVVDMEGYGIAFAAQQLGIRCEIRKVISDFANLGGPALIQQQIDSLSENMFQA